MLLDIRPDHLQIVQAILQKHVPQYAVWAFGSRAKWTAKDYSDLDLCVVANKPLSFSLLGAIAEDFSDSDLPWKVDVVDWATTSEGFRKIIGRDKVVVQKAGEAGRSEWGNESTIGQLVADFGGSIKTGPFGTVLKASEYVSEGVPLISVREIGHGSFHIDSKTPRVSPETTTRLSEYLLEAGDIVFARKGGIERCSLVRKAQAGWFLGSDGTRLRPPKNCDARFLAYSLQTQAVKDWLTQHSTGSTMASLNQATIARLPICIPAIDEQRKIAGCLEALDDRITLLRETNATLEAIAQALFKSWFVNFDPVHAKQQGRAPEGMDEATAALLPDSFEESELGWMPKGWRTCPIYDLATYINGAAYKAFESNSERHGLPIIKIAELKSGVTSQTAYSDVAMPQKYRIETGDILFSWSGNPDTSIDTFVWHHSQAWLNQHIFRVLPHATEERSFVLQMLKHLRPVFAELARNKQTTGLGHVTVADMKRLHVILPDKAALDLFNETVSPIHERVFENEKQAQTLATLRDTLLPRLISGQLRLPEAEAMAAEAL